MSTIRPPIFPTNTPPAPAQPPARSAAQRAFFEAATGRPAAAPAAARPQPQTEAGQTRRMPTSLPAEPPEKILRPGSILDIWV